MTSGQELRITEEILGREPDGDLRWIVGDGESVSAGQVVAEIETGKVTLEILSPTAGVLEVHLANGSLVQAGTIIGRIA